MFKSCIFPGLWLLHLLSVPFKFEDYFKPLI